MAAEEEEATPTLPADEENEQSEDESSDSDEGDDAPVESLIMGREKRATAGNRMSSLVEREGDEDLDLLFAENEEDEDVEFEDEDEAGSDAELDSSTDEEDQGPTKGNDDLTGEQELQQQEKAERRKRKAQDVFKKPSVLRKRVKIDDSTTTTPASPSESAPRPKKKSERVSWVHTAADAPTRTSDRRQTVENRKIVDQRLQESEKQREKVMQQMEEAQKKKEARRPKTMTQAERLEEAARVERKNAKSLNRWEEAEEKRAEEQRAKLEALQNRQLSGPVITSWSGITRWYQGKVSETGVREIREKGYKEQPVVGRGQSTSVDVPSSTTQRERQAEASVPVQSNAEVSQGSMGNTETHANASAHEDARPTMPEVNTIPTSPPGLLDGIHAYAALPTPQQQPEFTGTAHDDHGAPGTAARASSNALNNAPSAPASSPPPPPHLIPPEVEYTSRNLIALKSIDANAARLPELHDGVLLNKKKPPRLHKAHAELCAITNQPARFRDPRTGLPYANKYAYTQIQLLQKGGSRWSNLLDCYVGSSNLAARGVPDRFWKQPS